MKNGNFLYNQNEISFIEFVTVERLNKGLNKHQFRFWLEIVFIAFIVFKVNFLSTNGH